MTDRSRKPSRSSSSKTEVPPRPVREIAREAVADIDHALKLLRAWGVTVPTDSRLDRARVVLQLAADTGLITPGQRGDQLGLRSLELGFDYGAIADTLPATPLAAMRRELRDSLIGEIEPPESKRGPLQLQSQGIVRAAFVRAGLSPVHPTHSSRAGRKSPDLLLETEGMRYAVEAKRPQLLQNVMPRFEEGCAQVKGYGLEGGVLVDVTDCLRQVAHHQIDGEVDRLARMLYDRIFVEESGSKPGFEQIRVAGTYARVAWNADDGKESAMVNVHTSSTIGIFAPAAGTREDRHARWIRTSLEDGLGLLNRTLAETGGKDSAQWV